MWAHAFRSLADRNKDSPAGSKLVLRRVVTMFPDAANEKEMDPVQLVTEAALMPLSGLTPGKWELRDACSDGFPSGWSPSFMSTHYRVDYELVVRVLDLHSTSEPACGAGDVQRFFDARAPVWLTNNPGTLSAALADACADASISTGSGKEEAAMLSLVAAPVAVSQPPTPAAAIVEQPALPKGWAKKGASCTCRVACASGIRAGATLGQAR